MGTEIISTHLRHVVDYIQYCPHTGNPTNASTVLSVPTVQAGGWCAKGTKNLLPMKYTERERELGTRKDKERGVGGNGGRGNPPGGREWYWKLKTQTGT